MLVVFILLFSIVKYTFTQRTAMNYTWKPATFNDVPNIVNLSYTNHRDELNELFTVDPIIYERLIAHAVIDQYYTPTKELLVTAYADKLLGYTWAKVSASNSWSANTMLVAQMAQVDLTLPTRQRLRLLNDIFELWEAFAKLSDVEIICSNSILSNQSAFLELHRRHGYVVKGSYAYKKVSA
jgi:hypothetical protein